MNKLLLGGALGALAMYFLDFDSGRRRRARTRDRVLSAARSAGEAGRATVRDAAQRAQGLVAEARHLLHPEAEVADALLVERVRAAFGHVVSHPHAIEAFVDRGRVDLSGPILADEVRPLLAAVRRVPGVRGASDHLTVYMEAGNVPALQGGVPRRHARGAWLEDHWAPAARLLAGALGAGLLLKSLGSGGLRGAALGAAGSGLLARAVTNQTLSSLAGVAGPGITVQKVIRVEAPVDEVFTFWTDYQNFPRFMTHVKQVRDEGDGRSHWTVSGPAGVPVHWTAELTRVLGGQLIEWRATADSIVRHEGSVRFDPVHGGATRVMVRMTYSPPAGAFGHAVAAMFGADPKSEMDADLLRMKTMIEKGRSRDRPLSLES